MIGYVEEKRINKQELIRIEEEVIGYIIHRSIGAFTFLTPKTKMAVGSGVLISRDLILTSAHNLYDIYEGKENEDFKFYLGAHGTAEKYYELQSWRYPLEFTTCPVSEKLQYDYALVKLKQPIEYKEFLEISFSCDTCLMKDKQTSLKIFGYPKYGGNYKLLDVHGNKMKLSQFGMVRPRRIKVAQQQHFKIGYAITTEPGQSGCPIVAEEKIIAIHSGGGVSNQQFNIGRLITPDLVFNLQKWCKQLNGSLFTINKQNLCPHLINKLLEVYIQNSQLKKSEGQLKLVQDKFKPLPQNSRLQNPPNVLYSPKQEEVVKKQDEEELQQINQKLLQQAIALYHKGMDEWNKNNYSQARNYLFQSLEKRKFEEEEGTQSAQILSWIGCTYLFQKNYPKTIEHYNQTVIIYEKYHQETCQNYSVALNNLGYSYQQLKDFNSGVEYFEQRLLHNSQIKYQVGEIKSAKSLVKILIAMGKKQRANELSTIYKLSL